jgi:DNA-binding MarR family transcriptional regulator
MFAPGDSTHLALQIIRNKTILFKSVSNGTIGVRMFHVLAGVMAADESPIDLAWLLQRNGQRLRSAIDQISVAHGLSGGLRDYIVLTAMEMQKPKTQSELGELAGVDKTTLMALLDRLERDGLVERKLDPTNRRVRTPVLTPKGRDLQTAVTVARLRAADEVPGMTAAELKALRALLIKLDAACEEAGMKIVGSCV